MNSKANKYFSNLMAVVPEQYRRSWEKDIAHAEACQADNPASMDMLGIQQVSQHELQPLDEWPAAHKDTHEWIQKVIDIEELQYVPLIPSILSGLTARVGSSSRTGYETCQRIWAMTKSNKLIICDS